MISKLEAGSRDLSRETARRLSEALGVAASELLPPEPAEPEPEEVTAARAAVEKARKARDHIRLLVTEGKAGASANYAADYQLGAALSRWARALKRNQGGLLA